MIAGVVLGTIIFLLICAGAVLLVYAYFNPTSTTGEVIKVNYNCVTLRVVCSYFVE